MLRQVSSSSGSESPIRRRPPTMVDVARLAGVSQQTVSRVVNAREYVGEHTRERVLSAMRELNFRPNSAAQALVTGRSKTLGVISVDFVGFGPASVLRGLERAAHAHGYFVSVARLASPDRRSVLRALDQLQRQGVEDLLVNAGQDGITSELDRRLIDVPLVAIDDPREAVVPVVDCQMAGAAAATRLLLDLGHRRVSHIAGPKDWSSARRRMEGWRGVLESAQVPVAPPLFGDWSVRSGYELGRRLAQDRDVTAIFAGNDDMALGVMRAMSEQGGTARGQHHRIRRRSVRTLSDAAAHDGAPGLRGVGPAQHAAADGRYAPRRRLACRTGDHSGTGRAR